MDEEPERAPLVARTTEKLLAWTDILLRAAKDSMADLVLAYDDVIREMGKERQFLHEARVIERNSHPPPPPGPEGLEDRTTLPSPPQVPTIRSTKTVEAVHVISSLPLSTESRRQKRPKRSARQKPSKPKRKRH